MLNYYYVIQSTVTNYVVSSLFSITFKNNYYENFRFKPIDREIINF